MIDAATLDRLQQLPAEERLALAELLWDSLLTNPASIPLPDWHRDIVAERLDEDDRDQSPGESWADLRRRIEGKA